MTTTARWRALKSELLASSSHDFERKVVPVLRVRWPALVYPKSLKYLDQDGIDQLVVCAGSPLPVVVQCKGFEVQEPLGKGQLNQVRKSLDRFIASPHRCEVYLLVYNRFAADRAFHDAVWAELQRLLASHKASGVMLWDLNELGDQISEDLSRRVMGEIVRRGAERHRLERARFQFGMVNLSVVPHRVGHLRLRSHDQPELRQDGPAVVADPLRHWPGGKLSLVLVTGRFGAGKSTLAHRWIDQPGIDLISVPAAVLTSSRGAGSENALAQDIIDYLDLFGDDSVFNDEERRMLAHLGGPLLSQRWRNPRNRFVILIDAVDENRYYASARGFQVLVNELAHARCRVVLTTRLEHFREAFVNIGHALGGTSPWAARGIDIVELGPWGPTQAKEYVEAACALADDAQRPRLQALSASLSCIDGDSPTLQHPLFLAMTVDIVADEGGGVIGRRAELYRRWIQLKLQRDFAVDRQRPLGWVDDRSMVDAVLSLMVEVAAAMCDTVDGVVTLRESIDDKEVQRLARAVFGGVHVPPAVFATTSLLEPLHVSRFGQPLRLAFFHRSFHEYFLAVRLHADGRDGRGFPASVQELLAELQQPV